MKTYRCKHAVEAMRWTDTDADREAFSAWFEKHGCVFETRGPIALLPEIGLDPTPESTANHVQPGEWILFSDGEFIAMEDEMFWDTYEETP